MRIDTLYEFILLATNLNFTDTAKSFFIAQSALSNHISKLERELGAKLFTRDNRSVALTKVGKTFLEDAKKIVADYERALDNVAMCRQGTSSLLRIGSSSDPSAPFFPRPAFVTGKNIRTSSSRSRSSTSARSRRH